VSARQDEFERVVMCHARSLLRVARRLTSGSDLAEDLVQESLLLAWRSFHQLRAGTSAKAWLFRILFNSFYAQGRKLRRSPDTVPLKAELGKVTPRVDQTMMDQAMELSRALDSLPVDHRTVLLLGVVEGFTCNEVAEILAVPVGTVMSRLSRARQSMRTRLTASTANAVCAGKEA
jgi:RNA polymerase sigma-70 factor (ECF subfamily)